MVERADGVGTAAHARDNRIRKAPLLRKHLLLDLLGNDRLKIPHNRGERVRSHDRTEAVVGVADSRCPLAHGLRNRVLQGCGAGLYGNHRSAQKSHAVHVQSLADCILLAHEHHALHAEQRRCRGGGHAVLPCTGLGDQAGLAHLLRKKGLPQHVVNLVSAGVV